MKKITLLSAVLFVFVLLTAKLPHQVVAQSIDPPDVTDQRPSDGQESNDEPKTPLVLGDELFQTDIQTSTGHDCLLGVEYVDGYYYVTSGGATTSTEDNYLFKLSTDGTVVESWVQPTSALGWGWRDLAWDGSYLYASDSDTIVQINPTNGQTTGVTIASPVTPARALAYDPTTDHFWTANFASSIYEIDRSGTVVNTYSNSLGIYGLAWDADTDGGPYLWAWSQDGAPLVTATQIDPATGTATGNSFQGSSITVDDSAGGADISFDLVEGKTVLIGLHQSVPDSLVGYELSDLPDDSSWEQMDVCVPADTTPFAYINQPWDWVEGAVTPNSTVSAILKRGTTTIANASSTADDSGWFSFDFRNNGNHVDILTDDEITLNGGGLNETIPVVDIQGWIDVAGDSVAGYASGNTFDVWGVVCVREPFDPLFESKEVYFDANGRYDVDLSGQANIEYDYLAQVVVPDANGNYVVQVLYPEGLDLNVLITEDRVQGVTTPGAQVSVVVWDENGEKGAANTTADDTGFYSTQILVNGSPLDIKLGDHVGVSNEGHARETFLVMSHESWLQPWNKHVEGIVQGMVLPSGGTQGKVDLWSVSEDKWYSQYVWIEEDGQFGAEFQDVPTMSNTDRIRVWVSDGDGIQQASIGTMMDLGASIGNSDVWGYTIADSPVTVSLFYGSEGGNPIGLRGTAGTRADASGFFTATLTANSSPVGVTSGNIIRVENSEFTRDYYIGKIEILGDADGDKITIFGPANATAHVEGFRVGETDLNSYVWAETDLGEDGQVEVDLSSQDLLAGDIFEVVTYLEQDGVAIQRMRLVFDGSIFLPIITR